MSCDPPVEEGSTFTKAQWDRLSPVPKPYERSGQLKRVIRITLQTFSERLWPEPLATQIAAERVIAEYKALTEIYAGYQKRLQEQSKRGNKHGR